MNENDIWTLYFPIGFGATLGVWAVVQVAMLIKRAAEITADPD